MNMDHIMKGVIDDILTGRAVPVKREYRKELADRLKDFTDQTFTVIDHPEDPNRVVFMKTTPLQERT